MSNNSKENSVWAIEQGTSSLKVLKLARESGSNAIGVCAQEVIEWARESRESTDGEEARAVLAEFLERDEVQGARVAIVVPSEGGFVETVPLPPVEKNLLPKVIGFEAQNRLPLALDQLVWDFHLLDDPPRPGDPSARLEGVLAAARREVVDALLGPYIEAGVRVELCQPASVALANALAYEQSGEAGGAGPTALVDIGAARTVIVLTDGRRLWQRVVPLGGDRFTRALADRFKIPWPKAEALKREPFKVPDPAVVLRALRDGYEELANEIARSIGHLQGLAPDLSRPRVRLVGGASKCLGLESFLRGKLAYEIDAQSGKADMFGVPVADARFAAAIGLGAQDLGLGAIGVNLLPPRPGWFGGLRTRFFRSSRA